MPLSAAPTRTWSRGEELANCLSHALGFVAALGGAWWLISAALRRGDSLLLVGVIIFTLTAGALYFASAVHHALPEGPAKERFETLDHAAIFLLIAGSYTPVAFTVMRGLWGWIILGVVWATAIVGVVLRLSRSLQCPKISIALYVCMGWVMITAKPFWANLANPGLLLLAVGGIVYSAGIFFYLARGIRYHHLLWHLFVVAGTTCHFLAVRWMVG